MKIEQFYNKKEKRQMWRARFQFNNKEFTPEADSRAELEEIISEKVPSLLADSSKIQDLRRRLLKVSAPLPR